MGLDEQPVTQHSSALGRTGQGRGPGLVHPIASISAPPDERGETESHRESETCLRGCPLI